MTKKSNMTLLVLDMLKPHKPNILEFADALSCLNNDCSVNLKVVEIDEKTESVEIIIEGKDIDFDKVESAITELGGSIHSIDEVCVGSKVIRSDKR